MPTPPFDTTALQPFVKLAQANTDLVLRYAWSPAVANEMVRTAQAMVEQGQASFARLAGSPAFTALMQGLMTNWVEFLGDWTRTATGMMAGWPAAAMQPATVFRVVPMR